MKTAFTIVVVWFSVCVIFCWCWFRLKRKEWEQNIEDYEQEWLVQRLNEAYAAKEARRKGE